MTTFTINNTNSVFSAGTAFSGDSAGADTLMVEQSAFLISLGALAYGARLDATNAWKVTVNGVVTSGQFVGLGLIENNTGKSTITIGTEGEVFGSAISSAVFLGSAATLMNNGTITGGTGVTLFGSAAHTITNKGQITSTAGAPLGIQDLGGTSDDTVTNSGQINGDVDLGGGKNKITNSGTIYNFISGGGDDSFTNSGDTLDVTLGNGINTAKNTGTVDGNLTGGTGADKITSSHSILGNVVLGGGVNTFSNTGYVGGDVTATAGSSNTITNSKEILGSILLSDGADKVTNSGTVLTVDLGDGVNSLTNSGTISLLLGGAGVDTIKNTGTIFDIDLGAGDDKYTGGAKTDSIIDGNGADTIALGAGNDFYDATGAAADGLDKIDGGTGTDTYNAIGTQKVTINIDTVSHTGAAIGSLDPQYTVAKNIASGTDVGAGDNVLNFENVATGSNDDLVHGNAAANKLTTNAGNDIVLGYGGNDIVIAGTGADWISGGQGHDILFGGGADSAIDLFIYTALSDSTVAKAGRDLIADFEDGFDKIDLFSMDANSKIAGNQTFSFLGANVGLGDAGQVTVLTTATGYAIEADVTGDGKADFAVDVADTTHSIAWTSADFIL